MKYKFLFLSVLCLNTLTMNRKQFITFPELCHRRRMPRDRFIEKIERSLNTLKNLWQNKCRGAFKIPKATFYNIINQRLREINEYEQQLTPDQHTFVRPSLSVLRSNLLELKDRINRWHNLYYIAPK